MRARRSNLAITSVARCLRQSLRAVARAGRVGLPTQVIPIGSTTETCYASIDQGFPAGLATYFNSSTDNVTWSPRHNRDSYVESYYRAVQKQLFKNSLLDVAYVGEHGLKQLHVVEGGPHGLIWTHAAEVNTAMLDFLRR